MASLFSDEELLKLTPAQLKHADRATLKGYLRVRKRPVAEDVDDKVLKKAVQKVATISMDAESERAKYVKKTDDTPPSFQAVEGLGNGIQALHSKMTAMDMALTKDPDKTEWERAGVRIEGISPGFEQSYIKNKCTVPSCYGVSKHGKCQWCGDPNPGTLAYSFKLKLMAMNFARDKLEASASAILGEVLFGDKASFARLSIDEQRARVEKYVLEYAVVMFTIKYDKKDPNNLKPFFVVSNIRLCPDGPDSD